nr:ATP-binding cassette domain-containing protein [Clostridia bacterium]
MIKIENLVKHYGDKYAVNDISFTVEDGEIVGFLGPNGAGKSTTMNMITGYLSSTSGTASIDGYDILEDASEAKRLVGYLPEQPPLYLDMTVAEYLDFVYELKKCTLNRKKHIQEVCEVTKISDVYKRIIRNLSKGYRQRVGIAQALIGNPKVIILDEPTIGLDPKQIIEIRNLIRMLGRDHTVILSTHILAEVQAVCDRVVIINKGRVVADERTEDISKVVDGKRRYVYKICGDPKNVMAAIKSTPGVAYAELMAEHELDSSAYMIESEPGVDIRKSLFGVLAAGNYAILSVEAMGVSLEDIFISLVDKQDASKSKKRAAKEA